MKQLNLLYRKVMYFFSKKDITAILKYDPLNILQESEGKRWVNTIANIVKNKNLKNIL